MRKNRKGMLLAGLFALVMVAFALAGCGEEKAEAPVPDGIYTVDVTTDSNMFHINEANQGKGLLTVKDGQMTVHISLASKKIVNLLAGSKEDAQKEGAQLIEPTTDKIVYEDGYEMDVYGFDVPVPALDQEIPVAIIGTHGNWYDHTITVSNPEEGNHVPGTAEGSGAEGEEASQETQDVSLDELKDGDYQVKLSMEGGTGRATVESPAKMTVKDGKATLTVVWSSPNYDYMLVDGEKYEPVNEEGNSTFEIPVSVLGEAFPVTADTTAMSKPHEIDYQFTCKVLK